ncbi:MAG: hypothetical protein NTX03_14480 [Bacteroidetes bacterium]|nr:hypothetical protein [Bacteroidota bacterium]
MKKYTLLLVLCGFALTATKCKKKDPTPTTTTTSSTTTTTTGPTYVNGFIMTPKGGTAITIDMLNAQPLDSAYYDNINLANETYASLYDEFVSWSGKTTGKDTFNLQLHFGGNKAGTYGINNASSNGTSITLEIKSTGENYTSLPGTGSIVVSSYGAIKTGKISGTFTCKMVNDIDTAKYFMLTKGKFSRYRGQDKM